MLLSRLHFRNQSQYRYPRTILLWGHIEHFLIYCFSPNFLHVREILWYFELVSGLWLTNYVMVTLQLNSDTIKSYKWISTLPTYSTTDVVFWNLQGKIKNLFWPHRRPLLWLCLNCVPGGLWYYCSPCFSLINRLSLLSVPLLHHRVVIILYPL